MKIAHAVMAMAAVALLAGCSSASAAPVKDGSSYASLAELKDAYVKAGGACPSLSTVNDARAVGAGRCDKTFLFVFRNSDDVNANIDRAKSESGASPNPHPFLVGPDWVIDGPDASQVQGQLGGKLVSLAG